MKTNPSLMTEDECWGWYLYECEMNASMEYEDPSWTDEEFVYQFEKYITLWLDDKV